jgi:glycine/D-amino acid oxidase-like deaminating enzyme/nitrite reductase/ring-hydroxylating ferredoxin subunit
LDKEVDVVIVGGGIAGVSIAYNLARAGKKVAIVEDGFIGSGETGRTTAHLVSALDDRYYELERLFGEEDAKLIAQSHASAIDFVERTVSLEKIDCDFERVNGYLFLHPSDEIENLEKEYEAAKRAGLDIEMTDIVLADHALRRAIKFNNQAQFHPLKYLKGLCEAIVKNGGDIYTNTHAKEIDHTGIETNEGFKIKAQHVVIATNSPVNNKYRMHLKQYPYRTYVIGAKIKKDTLPHALWWDTGDFEASSEMPPYHYIRLQKLNDTHDLLIVGGEDHATGLADVEKKPEENRYDSLESWAREHFEGIEEITYRWSGQVLEPMDSLAFIGRNPANKENVYIATGDSGNGMTHATIAGMLIRDIITDKKNKLEKIYDPGRVKIFKAGKTFLKEFVGGFINYLKTKPGSADETSLRELKNTEGKIFEFAGKKIGAYRDEEGQLHFVSAECMHLGCIVKWNNDEKSWDCPCHGSRYTYEGKILNGPTNMPLTYYSHKKDLIQQNHHS